MIPLNFLHYSVLLFILSVLLVPFINYLSQDLFKLESSIRCFQNSNQTNHCKFKNICYDSQHRSLLFFLGNNTVIRGFNHYSELHKIQLSSVKEHNQFYANLSIVDSANYLITKKIKIYSKVVLISRFKPNNLMHCIHDDLFPLFLTLESECLGHNHCMENYDLIFHDNHPKGPFFNLYNLFSKHSPVLLNELPVNSEFILCFKEMLTGLILDGVVYQYGFKTPHGPIAPYHLKQGDVSKFTTFIKNKLQIIKKENSSSELLLFKREKNRKILNVDEVQKMINKSYKRLNRNIIINVINLNLFSNDLTALIKIVSEADGVIGMHGAEMILSLFLKPNSFVFEIFPFGIKPEIVSFVKPFSELQGCNFVYFSWRNKKKNNSVTHPDAPPLYGGISHLDDATQMKIKTATEVPAMKCCNNPLFLYHMYQDTLISNDFENFFYKSLAQVLYRHLDSRRDQILKNWFYPYVVHNISCNFNTIKNLLSIDWNPPFNVHNQDNLFYSLYVKDEKGLFSKDIQTEKTALQLEMPVGVNSKFQVWISVYLKSNNFKSPDLYVNCITRL